MTAAPHLLRCETFTASDGHAAMRYVTLQPDYYLIEQRTDDRYKGDTGGHYEPQPTHYESLTDAITETIQPQCADHQLRIVAIYRDIVKYKTIIG
jgi:hypothetical protein